MARSTAEIRREQEIANQARPIILSMLQKKKEPLEIGREISSRFDVGDQLAFRWAQYVSEEYYRKHRRVVAIGLALLWTGVLAIVAGVVLVLLGLQPIEVPSWVAGLIVGIPLATAGAVVIARAARLVRLSE